MEISGFGNYGSKKFGGPAISSQLELKNFPKQEEGIDFCSKESSVHSILAPRPKSRSKNFFNFFSVLVRAKTFASNIRIHSSMKNIQHLGPMQCKMIGDSAFEDPMENEKSPNASKYGIRRSLNFLKGRTKVNLKRGLYFTLFHFAFYLQKLYKSALLLRKRARRNFLPAVVFYSLLVKSFKIFLLKLSLIYTRNVPILKSSSKIVAIWTTILSLTYLWLFFTLFLNICFIIPTNNIEIDYNDFISTSSPIYQRGLLIIVLFNMFLKLNTGVFKNGVEVLDRKEILKGYLTNDFSRDIICCLPGCLAEVCKIWESVIFLESYYFKTICLVFYVKYKEYYKISVFMQEYFTFGKEGALFDLISLILKVLFFAHFYACVWHFSSRINDKTSWMDKLEIIDEEWPCRYLYSLYFSITTMITVGYGDITPQNSLERVLCIFGMLVGSGLFGYSTNQIGTILHRMNLKKNNIKSKLRTINRFFKKKNIDHDLQVRIKQYIEFAQKDDYIECSSEELELLELLPFNVREEVYLNTRGRLLEKHPVFGKIFSKETLKKLIHVMRPVSFSPEEIIFTPDSASDSSIFFISKGDVDLCWRKSNNSFTPFKTLSEYGILGEKEFFGDGNHLFLARSKGFSSGYRINKKDFIETISTIPQDYETYCLIRDKILLYESWTGTTKACNLCNCGIHYEKNCAKLFHVPFKKLIILKHLKNSTKQERSRFRERKTKKSMRSLSTLREQQRICEEWIAENNDLVEEFSEINNPLHNKFDFPQRSLVYGEPEQMKTMAFDRRVSHFNLMDKKLPSFKDWNELPTGNDAYLESQKSPFSKLHIPFYQEKDQSPQILVDNTKGLQRLESGKTDLFSEEYGRCSPKRSRIEEIDPNFDNYLGYGFRKAESWAQNPDNKTNPTTEATSKTRKTKKLEPMFDGKFDVMRNFKIYFPHNNSDKVVNSIIKIRTRTGRSIKTRTQKQTAKQKMSVLNISNDKLNSSKNAVSFGLNNMLKNISPFSNYKPT